MPTGTTTTTYQFFKPDDNQTGWGAAVRNFIDIVDRDLHASIVFVDIYQSIVSSLDSDIALLKALVNSHINQVQGAHAASAISETTDGDVQTALNKIRAHITEIESIIAALTARMTALEAAIKAIPPATSSGGTQTSGGEATPTFQVNLSAPTTAKVGSSVSFSVAPSGSTGESISSARWDFGDGGTASSASTSHTYTAPGTYYVGVDAVSSAQRVGTGMATIIVTA